MTPGCRLVQLSAAPLPTHTLTLSFCFVFLRAAAGSVHRHLPRCLPLPASPTQLLLPEPPRDVPGPRGTSQKAPQALLHLLGASPSLDALCPKTPSLVSAVFPASSPLPSQCRLLRGAALTSPGFHQLFLRFTEAGQRRQKEAELRRLNCPNHYQEAHKNHCKKLDTAFSLWSCSSG